MALHGKEAPACFQCWSTQYGSTFLIRQLRSLYLSVLLSSQHVCHPASSFQTAPLILMLVLAAILNHGMCILDRRFATCTSAHCHHTYQLHEAIGDCEVHFADCLDASQTRIAQCFVPSQSWPQRPICMRVGVVVHTVVEGGVSALHSGVHISRSHECCTAMAPLECLLYVVIQCTWSTPSTPAGSTIPQRGERTHSSFHTKSSQQPAKCTLHFPIPPPSLINLVIISLQPLSL